MDPESFARFENLIGNAIGTAGKCTNYTIYSLQPNECL